MLPNIIKYHTQTMHIAKANAIPITQLLMNLFKISQPESKILQWKNQIYHRAIGQHLQKATPSHNDPTRYGDFEVKGRTRPHHPRGSYIVKKDAMKQEFNEHLNNHDQNHLEQDLTGMHVKHVKDVSAMSDEEKSFYYFKIHDTDNNNNLDGLEMIKAALHRHHGEDEQIDPDELIHITNVVDEFLLFADLDVNGFLNYAEYVKAMNASDDGESSKIVEK